MIILHKKCLENVCFLKGTTSGAQANTTLMTCNSSCKLRGALA